MLCNKNLEMKDTNDNLDIEKLTFEEAMQELETIVSSLENGSIELEESIKQYTRGIKLKKHCEEKIKEANTKIEEITIDKQGNVKKKPFDRKK